MTPTNNKALRPTQKKALEICHKAEIREYCLKVNLFKYDLNNPTENGDCNNTITLILGDFVTYMIEAKPYFNGMPEVTPDFLKKIRRKKTSFVYSSKKQKARFKVVITTDHVKMCHWNSAIERLWNFDKYQG